MCATENGLDQRAFYGPIGRLEFSGPVGKGILLDYAYDPRRLNVCGSCQSNKLDAVGRYNAASM